MRRGTLAELAAAAAAEPPRGEVVLVIDRGREAPDAEDMEAQLREALKTMTVKDAASAVAEALSLPRRQVYQAALKMAAALEENSEIADTPERRRTGRSDDDAGRNSAGTDQSLRGPRRRSAGRGPFPSGRSAGARTALARPGGEIDLICGDDGGLVFVEVKKGKDHSGALARVTPRQLDRIRASAEAYAACMPRGALTDMRIDIALVDVQGRIAIVENVTMH